MPRSRTARQTIDPERRKRARRNAIEGLSQTAVGLVAGIALTIGAWFVLYDLRARTCPPDTFVFGSTSLGTLLATIPWLFVGMFVGFVGMAFVIGQLPRPAAPASTENARRRNRRQWMSLLLKAIPASAVLAFFLSSYGAIAGFCAGPDGVSFKRTPWSATRTYQWTDVQGITVICYRWGRSYYTGYLLTMSDRTDIDLYNMAPSFDRGYPMVSKALHKGSYVYINQVGASCNSSLRYVSRP